MTQHTPGPWEILYNDPEEEYWVTRPHYDAGPAKIVYHIEDARLIAAAPDLLEALQHLMVAHGEQLDYAFQQAQEAIAKATGEKNGN
jgi:hypothetical protein